MTMNYFAPIVPVVMSVTRVADASLMAITVGLSDGVTYDVPVRSDAFLRERYAYIRSHDGHLPPPEVSADLEKRHPPMEIEIEAAILRESAWIGLDRGAPHESLTTVSVDLAPAWGWHARVGGELVRDAPFMHREDAIAAGHDRLAANRAEWAVVVERTRQRLAAHGVVYVPPALPLIMHYAEDRPWVTDADQFVAQMLDSEKEITYLGRSAGADVALLARLVSRFGVAGILRVLRLGVDEASRLHGDAFAGEPGTAETLQALASKLK